MSDGDRLRVAAATLDRRAARLVGEGSQVTRGMCATAALLRAVAAHAIWKSGDYVCDYCGNDVLLGHHAPDCPWPAALAVADTVLGVTDE